MMDSTLEKMGNLIANQKGLQKCSINIRSWGYCNEKITDSGFDAFFRGITKLSDLRTLKLGLRGMTYNNTKVTTKSIFSLANALKSCQRIEEIGLNFEVWSGI